MPNILSLDTSSDYCSVALHANGEFTALSELAPRSHTQLLLPMAKQIVETHGLALADLHAIAFGSGPGSFTGLRIAAGVAQGLAYGLGCSILPISNLQAMALQSYKQHGSSNILVAIDARMNEVYWSFCHIEASEQTAKVTTPNGEHVSTPETITLAANIDQLVGIGSGFEFFERFPSELQQKVSQFNHEARPKADEICQLALSAVRSGVVGALNEAMPTYIRDKVTWQKLPGRE